MKNFIFISPNFPTNYWQFCRELKNKMCIRDSLSHRRNQGRMASMDHLRKH